MKQVDLQCPNCGAVLESKENLENMDTGSYDLTCSYCGYKGILKKEKDKTVSLKDLEDQTYAKARGQYKAQRESQRRSTFSNIVALIIFGAIVFGIILFVRNRQEANKITVNPFDYIEVNFTGLNGQGQVEVKPLPAGEDGVLSSNISYQIENRDNISNSLYEGDVITITADSEEYKLSQNQQNYTVEGLDLYLGSLDEINEESLEPLHSLTKANIEEDINEYRDEFSFVDIQPAGVFLISDQKNNNSLYDIFRVDYELTNGIAGTIYMGNIYYDILVRESESGPSIDYDRKWGAYDNTFYLNDGSVFGPFVSGYTSLEGAKADAMTSQEEGMSFSEIIYEE